MLNDRLFFWVQALLKNIPFKSFVWVRQVLYKPFFKQFGKNVRIMDCVTIKYPSKIKLGDEVVICEYSYLAGLGGVSIGNQCIFGAGTKITSSTHQTDSCDDPIVSQGLKVDRVDIGNDVFLGFDVKVLPGVTIGDGCIVGAGAVLLKGNYEEYSNVAGVPAKLISKRRS